MAVDQVARRATQKAWLSLREIAAEVGTLRMRIEALEARKKGL